MQQQITDESGYVFGDIVDYFCDDGFVLEGNTEVTCQSNGEWSGSPPTCLPVVCPIEEVENGYYR